MIKIKNDSLLPRICYGDSDPLVYVVNQKAGCTLAKHFIYRINNGYFHDGGQQIHKAVLVGLQYKIWGKHLIAGNPTVWDRITGRNKRERDRWIRRHQRFLDRNPPVFSIVRNPVDRLISGFVDKILVKRDGFQHIHDHLSKNLGLDIDNPEHLPQAAIGFTKLLEARGFDIIDRHFRPQTMNLGRDIGLKIHTIIKLDDKETLRAFFASYIGEEDADLLLARRFNTTSERYPKKLFMCDELTATVKRVFASDYEAYFQE